MLMFNNVDPGDLFVCHHCDVHLCVNPKHLFIGTAKDNMQDAVRKGRNSREQPAVDRALNAKRVARRKLTEAQALDIFNRARNGERIPDLAAEHGIIPNTVERILNGDTWSHLTGVPCKRHYWKKKTTCSNQESLLR